MLGLSTVAFYVIFSLNYISMKRISMKLVYIMTQKFIGREQELQTLEKLQHRDGFQMLVMYGRRRVGKSTLLQKFADGKRAIFYTAIRSGAQRNLELLSQRVLQVLAPELPNVTFPSYEELFTFIGQAAQKERLLFIIDELPYLVEQAPSLLSMMQKAIDNMWLSGQLFLILCGSSISFMENEVLGEKSPLFGRRTAQLALQPFAYWDAAKFVHAYTPEQKAICYGVTGGVAKYLALFDDQRPLDENLCDLFFDKAGYLYEEPENLLTQEYRNVTTYNAIIGAIASGRTKLTQIADLTHLEPSKIAHAVRNLCATGILSKECAITDERNKKKIRYHLADSMFRFWYRFVPDGIDAIGMGHGDIYYKHVVKPHLSDYMGEVFEEMCRAYTLRAGLTGQLPCLVTKVGKWWGTNPRTHEETDIDVVALDTAQKQAILGECKFRNEPIDKSVFEQLQQRNGLIDNRYRVIAFLLFSKTGFSDWIMANKRDASIYTITLEEMYNCCARNSPATRYSIMP